MRKYSKKDDCALAEESVKRYKRWIHGLQSYEDIIKNKKYDGNKENIKDYDPLYEPENNNDNDINDIISYFDKEINKLKNSIISENCNILTEKTTTDLDNIENQENILDKEKFDVSFLDEMGGSKRKNKSRRKHTKKNKKSKKHRKHRK